MTSRVKDDTGPGAEGERRLKGGFFFKKREKGLNTEKKKIYSLRAKRRHRFLTEKKRTLLKKNDFMRRRVPKLKKTRDSPGSKKESVEKP